VNSLVRVNSQALPEVTANFITLVQFLTHVDSWMSVQMWSLREACYADGIFTELFSKLICLMENTL
jgi:hypothetical protein